MGSSLSKNCETDNLKCFMVTPKCDCSSENWKSYQMDLNTILFVEEHDFYDALNPNLKESDVVVIYFQCSSCNCCFCLSTYYKMEDICQEDGYFRRICENKSRNSITLAYENIQSIVEMLKEADNSCDLYNEILKFFVDASHLLN